MADEKTRISAKTYEVELRDLWPKIFLAFDSDNSGSINRAELLKVERLGSAQQLVKLMQAADDNNDNEISMEEWAEMFDSLCKKMGKPNRETYLKCLKMYNSLTHGGVDGNELE
mmetsp:Transcript_35180/g.49210  ORF Transcript_35180/g.49210 Transcript_35180/m.49210 type:complete len:114 (-) Transcript_35180:202-543(-)